jgi:hypothetical protein
LRNTLGQVLSAADFKTLDLDPGARAQTLGVREFVRITNYRYEQGSNAHASRGCIRTADS